MNQFIKHILFLSLFLLSYGVVDGQNVPENVVYLPVNGLPKTDYYETAQDNQGFIYFATDLGLLRYDGQKVKCISDIGILRNAIVYSVRKFADGDLLIFVKDQGYYLYKDSKFYPFKLNKEIKQNPQFANNGHATFSKGAITCDGRNVYLISSTQKYIKLLTKDSQFTLKTYIVNGQFVNLPSDSKVLALVEKTTGFQVFERKGQSTNVP